MVHQNLTVCEPFGQFTNNWISLSFLALKNLSENKKVVPFPGKRVNYRWSFVGARVTHAGGCSGLALSICKFPHWRRPTWVTWRITRAWAPTGPFVLPLVLRGHEQMTYSSLSRVPSNLYVVGSGFSVRDKFRVRPPYGGALCQPTVQCRRYAITVILHCTLF